MIVLTGCSSGIGAALKEKLADTYCITRDMWDMDTPIPNDIVPNNVTMLINIAGHDVGGKINFSNHKLEHWSRVLQTNLVSTMALTHQTLNKNPTATIVNITSTNVDQYWPNDLVYSLSKVALSEFTKMLRIEYNNEMQFREVRLGLTKTNFVKNRYAVDHAPVDDLYSKYEHLLPKEVAQRIVEFIDTNENFIRIAP